jgi:hypothetical protein
VADFRAGRFGVDVVAVLAGWVGEALFPFDDVRGAGDAATTSVADVDAFRFFGGYGGGDAEAAATAGVEAFRARGGFAAVWPVAGSALLAPSSASARGASGAVVRAGCDARDATETVLRWELPVVT